MEHLQILFLFFNLFLGVLTILYLYQIYKKYKESNILTLIYYSISFNILVFADLSYKYLMANIFKNIFFEIPYFITLILLCLVFVTEYAITYYLYLFILKLNNKHITSKRSNLFIAWIAFFTSASIIGMFMYYSQDNENWFYHIHELWIFSMDLIILFSLISHLIKSVRLPKTKIRKLLESFGFLFLIGYIGFALSHINFYFIHYNVETYDSIILLLINLCPLVWIRIFYLKHQITTASYGITPINKFAKEFNLTVREKEVVELIMKGKTNNEIEACLLISFNTVKNHIYNIFKKTGANSRSQLLYFITNYKA